MMGGEAESELAVECALAFEMAQQGCEVLHWHHSQGRRGGPILKDAWLLGSLTLTHAAY